jgi:nucleoside-diphosphate-sugar epimerase
MDLQRDGRVFADFVGNVVRGEDIVVKSDGSGRRAFCYLADTLEALLLILLGGGDGGCYNVGNAGAILSVGELADLLAGLAPQRGLKKILLGTRSPPSPAAEVFPNTARLEKLGWTPRTSAVDGFSRTLRSYTT